MANYLNNNADKISPVDKILNMIDQVPNFIQHWPTIDYEYRTTFKFEELSDAVRIIEYRKVSEMYKKYLKEKGKKIKSNLDCPVAVRNMINVWLTTELQKPGGGWTREFIVYTKLSKDWLIVLRNFVNEMIHEEEQCQ